VDFQISENYRNLEIYSESHQWLFLLKWAHIITEISFSVKVTNATATVYKQELIHKTQVHGNVSNKRIELIDEIIVNMMKLFSDPSKFFWIKRNNINAYDCYKKVIDDNDYEDYFD